MNDHALAARLATEAGRLLLGVREEFADAEASERKAAGDKRSHDFLMEALANERPKHLYARLGFRPVTFARTWVRKLPD